MKRTTVFIEDDILRELRRVAQRRGVSVALVVREAMAAYVASPVEAGIPSIAGRFASGHSDTSERVDELLARDPHE